MNDRRRPIRGVTVFLLLLSVTAGGMLQLACRSEGSETTWWKPTADRPLRLSWILGKRIDFESRRDMGTVDMAGRAVPGGADVFDLDLDYTRPADVKRLHGMGKKVICYFDAGVWERYRKDAGRFPKEVIGAPDQGWNGSRWLDIRRTGILKPIMTRRMDRCRAKGFDAVEPDEITNWSNRNGFDRVKVNGHRGITYRDQLRYNRALARWAHARGLGIGLKGDLEQAHDLAGSFDWSLNEECIQYRECTRILNRPDPDQVKGLRGADGRMHPGLQVFTRRNKAVWIAEYRPIGAAGCRMAKRTRFNAARYRLGLPGGAGSLPCPGFAPR